MGRRGCRRMPAYVALVTLSLVVAPGGTLAPWIPVVLSAAEIVAPDAPWPRRFQAADGSIVTMFEPQIASWDNQKKMEVYAAVTHARSPSAWWIFRASRSRSRILRPLQKSRSLPR